MEYSLLENDRKIELFKENSVLSILSANLYDAVKNVFVW